MILSATADLHAGILTLACRRAGSSDSPAAADKFNTLQGYKLGVFLNVTYVKRVRALRISIFPKIDYYRTINTKYRILQSYFQLGSEPALNIACPERSLPCLPSEASAKVGA